MKREEQEMLYLVKVNKGLTPEQARQEVKRDIDFLEGHKDRVREAKKEIKDLEKKKKKINEDFKKGFKKLLLDAEKEWKSQTKVN